MGHSLTMVNKSQNSLPFGGGQKESEMASIAKTEKLNSGDGKYITGVVGGILNLDKLGASIEDLHTLKQSLDKAFDTVESFKETLSDYYGMLETFHLFLSEKNSDEEIKDRVINLVFDMGEVSRDLHFDIPAMTHLLRQVVKGMEGRGDDALHEEKLIDDIPLVHNPYGHWEELKDAIYKSWKDEGNDMVDAYDEGLKS